MFTCIHKSLQFIRNELCWTSETKNATSYFFYSIVWYNRSFPAWTNVSKDLTVNLLNELYSSHDISYDTSNEYESVFGLLWLLNHSDIFMLLTTAFRLLPFFSTTYQVLRRFGCSSKKCLQPIRYTIIFFAQKLAWNTKDILSQNSVNIWFLKGL